jgi:pyrimidine-specific ribonucleoside hydrolase
MTLRPRRFLDSGLAIIMYGLDVFNQVLFSSAEIDSLSEQEHPATKLAGELLRVRPGRLIGDAGALIALTNPGLLPPSRRRSG